jgi:hypothetical protein
MQNFATVMAPHPVGNGTYAISHVVTPQTQLPLIETVADTGQYVGSILANPDAYEGKVFSAATEICSFEEIVKKISKATGKVVKYYQLPLEIFRGFFPSHAAADMLIEMILYIQDFGYYGRQTKS